MADINIKTSLRLGTLAALLATSLGTAQAGGMSVGVNVGVPVWGNAVHAAGGPVGVLSVRGGNGGYRGGYRGGHGGYYRGSGWGWGLGLGIGAGLLLASPWVYPGVVVTQPPTTVVIEQPPQPPVQAQPAQPARPDPIIYPRNGQSAEQLEADRQECNRWATTQPQALADSSVFMRAIDACMDGRGYTTK